MNFKMKLAAIAALSAMLAAPAFAVTDVTLEDGATTTAAALNDIAVIEFGKVTVSGDGNYAQIGQEGGANLAYIDQAGGNNFASIAQTNDAAIATIYQLGDANRAAIVQR